MPIGIQGDSVAIEFTSADATTAALITIKDADDKTRTLAAYERLLIDSLTADVASATVPVQLFADANNDGAIAAGEAVVSFNTSASLFEGGFEGFSIPTGITPKVKAAAAGNVKIFGTARIIKGKSEGVRPSWRESQIPGK